MKNKNKIIIAIILLAIAYLIGVLFPIRCLIPNVDWDRKISSGELFYYSISLVQALGTVAAVIIALFSDNIKTYFRKPRLDVKLHNNDLIEELESAGESNLKAKRYYNSVDIYNKGNANAENCEVCIESIFFQESGNNSLTQILDNELTLKWSGNEEKGTIYIPVKGKKSFQLYEIFPPEEQGTPGGGDTTQIPAKLVIGNFTLPSEYRGGLLEINFFLYTPCLTPLKFKIIINWDGTWENRQMEMKKKFVNKIEVLNN